MLGIVDLPGPLARRASLPDPGRVGQARAGRGRFFEQEFLRQWVVVCFEN
jgi:hypothetical protein